MAEPGPTARDLPRTVLVVLFILGLTVGCLWILRPFLTALIGATTIAISTWPMLTGLQRRCGGRRGPAVALMMAFMALVILIPLYFGAVAAVRNAGALSAWVRDLPNRTPPALPDRLAHAPFVGERLQKAWGELFAAGGEGMRARLSEHAGDILGWLMGRLGNLVGMLVEVLITLGITGLLYATGERVADFLLRFARRLGGAHGEQAARLAALATRGVGLGVVLTPLIQSILAAIGLAAAGAPRVALFAVAVLLSCLAQAGPIPALLIPVIWLYSRGAVLSAIGLLAWTLVVHISGPILRPLLIRRGVDLPIVLIISGVIGGVMAFGVVGLFIGPVLLAVATTLLKSWMAEEDDKKAETADARPAAGLVAPATSVPLAGAP